MDMPRCKITAVVSYMPHSGYGDEAVHDMYSQIDEVMDRVQAHKRVPIVMGDWNAVVGASAAEVEEKLVHGGYGVGLRNGCGPLLVEWAAEWQLQIATTHFLCTHVRADVGRQIDFIMMPRRQDVRLLNAEVVLDMCLCSDHRPLRAKWQLFARSLDGSWRRKKTNARVQFRSWQQTSLE